MSRLKPKEITGLMLQGQPWAQARYSATPTYLVSDFFSGGGGGCHMQIEITAETKRQGNRKRK